LNLVDMLKAEKNSSKLTVIMPQDSDPEDAAELIAKLKLISAKTIALPSHDLIWLQDMFETAYRPREQKHVLIDLPYRDRAGDDLPEQLSKQCSLQVLKEPAYRRTETPLL